jgi:uncharacterized membrane protein HdeD (DUF308 family)
MIGVRETMESAEVRQLPPPEQLWYLMVLTGLISLGIGVVVVAHPSTSLKTLCVLVGVYLLVAAAIMIVKTFTDDDRAPVGILIGILGLIAGVVVIRHPGQSLVAVALVLGLYFLIEGALDIAHAITGPRRLLHLLRGVLLIVAGTVIVASPHISLKTLAIVTGLALIVSGALQIGEGFILRSQRPAA